MVNPPRACALLLKLSGPKSFRGRAAITGHLLLPQGSRTPSSSIPRSVGIPDDVWGCVSVVQVLQMELMFSKLASLESDSKKATNGVGAGGAEEEGGGQEEEEEDVLSLEPVSVQRFEASLSGGHWGLHAYVPVTFSGVHFVRVDCMVGRVVLVVSY